MFNKKEVSKSIRRSANEFYFRLLALMEGYDDDTCNRTLGMLMAINQHRNELMNRLARDTYGE